MSLFNSKAELDGPKTSEQEWTLLSDSYNEFNKINAFLVFAMANLMSSDDPVPEDVCHGAKYCEDYIRSRSQELGASMEQLRMRMLHQNTGDFF